MSYALHTCVAPAMKPYVARIYQQIRSSSSTPLAAHPRPPKLAAIPECQSLVIDNLPYDLYQKAAVIGMILVSHVSSKAAADATTGHRRNQAIDVIYEIMMS